MNNYDVAGVLQTYAKMCRKAHSDTQLQELVRRLKKDLNYNEIKDMYVMDEQRG